MEQGITAPLIAKREGDGKGKIIKPKVPNKITSATTDNSSRVVLLKNMVGLGEVDNQLESETIEECSKYGKVHSCKIREIKAMDTKSFSSLEHVHIYVKFDDVTEAKKGFLSSTTLKKRRKKLFFFVFDFLLFTDISSIKSSCRTNVKQ